MNKYESIIILKPDYKEEEKQEILDFCKKHMKGIKYEELGKKELAYEVKGYNEGYYIQFEFNKNEKKITEFFKNNLTILKFIIVKMSERKG